MLTQRIARMRISTVFIFLLSALSAGCLRYTPARSELENRQEPSADERSAGPDQSFAALESERQARLQALAAERASLVAGGGQQAYRIGRGDLIEVSVFGLPEMTAVERVSPGGTIALSLVGETQVEGLTVNELRHKAAELYRRYVRNPQVRVQVSEYEASKVSVLGEVINPGSRPLKSTAPLLTEVIAQAGGRTPNAGTRIVLIPAFAAGVASEQRDAAKVEARVGEQAAVEIEFEEITGSADRPPVMIPVVAGDTIIVPEAGTFEVDGEVMKPGSYRLSPRLSLLGAVAAAGGLTYSAKVNEVEVIRDFGSGRKAAMRVDLEKIALQQGDDVKLQSGDVVRVPSASGRFATRQVMEAIRSVFDVGVSGNVR